jgi:hypothetical protein
MKNNKVLLEIVWWIVTAVILTAIMFPIWKNFPDFKFNVTNIVYVVCFITFTRYAFLLKYTFLANWEKGKIAFVICVFAIAGILFVQMQDFNVWYDNGNPDVLLKSVKKENLRPSLLEFIKTEFVFFAVASVIAAFLLAGRLLVSVWRLRNRGKV